MKVIENANAIIKYACGYCKYSRIFRIPNKEIESTFKMNFNEFIVAAEYLQNELHCICDLSCGSSLSFEIEPEGYVLADKL